MRRIVFTLAMAALCMSPAAAGADDQTIAQAIVQRLNAEKERGALKGFKIDLEVDQGTVWLKGHVSDKQQHTTVLEMARRVPGVRQVVNDLDIACEAPQRGKPLAEPVAIGTGTQSVLPTFKEIPKLETLKKADELPKFKPQIAENRGEPRSAASQGVFPRLANHFKPEAASQPKIEAPAKTKTDSRRPDIARRTRPDSMPQLQLAQQIGTSDSTQGQPVQRVNHDRISASDQQIAQTLVGRLEEEERAGLLQGCAIDLHVEDQVIFLEGNCSAQQQLVSVVDIARRITGVRQVVNGLRVENPIRRTAAAQQLAPPAQPGPAYAPQGYAPQGPQPQIAHRQVAAQMGAPGGVPVPMQPSGVGNVAGVSYDHPQLPGYAWPGYASHPNYAALTYPRQYSPSAWPYIGPFYPYPQVPLGWRSVQLQWDDGWWFLDYKSK